jgi:hypothetical protein
VGTEASGPPGLLIDRLPLAVDRRRRDLALRSSRRSKIGGPDQAACSQIPASQLVAQPRVLTLQLGQLPVQLAFGHPQLLAAGPSRPPHAQRPNHQQANHEPERGSHGQKQATAVTGDQVVQHRDGVGAGVLQHKVTHHRGADDCQQ